MTGFTSPTNKHSTPPTTSPLNKGFEPTIKNSSLINSIGIGEFNDYPLHQDGASIIKGNINLANVGITLANLALNPTTTETTSITSENKVVNLKITAEKIDFQSLKTNVPSLLSDIKACLLDSIQFHDSFIPVTKLYSDTQNHEQPAEPKKLIHLYLHLISAIKKITTAKDINPDIKQNILFQELCETAMIIKNIEENYGKKIIANRPDTYISKDIENILINKLLKQANFTKEKITEESTLILQKLLYENNRLLEKIIQCVHEKFVEVCKKYNDNFTNVILEDIERIFLTDLKSGVYDFMIKDYINHKLSTFDSSNSHASN
ncbi:hypothetical protein ACTFIZ_012908 [Dictyostelium cf. discoideum]